MKQIFTTISLLIFSISFAQNGIGNNSVEKCYKSSSQETIATADGGILLGGSVAYWMVK